MSLRNWHLYQDRRIKSASAMLRLIGQRGILPRATDYDADYLFTLIDPAAPGKSIVIAEDQIAKLMAHPESARLVEFRQIERAIA